MGKDGERLRMMFSKYDGMEDENLIDNPDFFEDFNNMFGLVAQTMTMQKLNKIIQEKKSMTTNDCIDAYTKVIEED
jgi:hypothetical protein